MAHFQGPRTAESESFWRCLSLQYPGLAQEATDAFNMNAMASSAYTAAKTKTVRASRLFFTAEMEQSIIRRLAVEMGYIPADTDVLHLTEAERNQVIQGRGDIEFFQRRVLGWQWESVCERNS